jgi:hypothetical protein
MMKLCLDGVPTLKVFVTDLAQDLFVFMLGNI